MAPGVHRLPLPLPTDGLRAVNVYAVASDDELVLIDGGWALEASRTALATALASLDRELGDISRFLVTHVHRDHYTQAVAVRTEYGTHVSLGEGERRTLELLASPGHRSLDTQLARLRVAGAAPLVATLEERRGQRSVDPSVWQLPDAWITDGQVLEVPGRRLRAIATPGHTRGHVVFADLDGGVLFAGDHVLPHITPSIALEAADASLPLADYLGSLAAMRDLPDLRLLPAHGHPAGGVHDRVDELLAHHEDRLDAAADAVAAGAVTGYEAARALAWTSRATAFDDLDPFNQMLAVAETLAHLDLLVARERLTRTTDDGVSCFAVPSTT